MFREARLDDAETTWRWRLEDERQSFYDGARTTFSTHEAWFARNLERISIWEMNGKALGAARIESDGTLNFSAERRKQWIVISMVRACRADTTKYGGRLKAVIDERDTWRRQILRAAGFKPFPATAMIYKP